MVEPSGTFRVLVVDDEGLARRMMTRAIGAAGHFCSSTGSGEEAIELLELQQFDLAVIDKNLPDVSGLEVTRRARGLRRSVPVIVVTGFPSEDSEREARRLGAARYLVKPFETHELQHEVLQVLRASWGPAAAGSAVPAEEPPPVEKITLPARRGSSPGRDASETVRAGADRPSESGGLPNVSVLLLESNPQLRTKLVDALTELGCRVVAFQSRFQAEVHVRYVGYEVLVARSEVLLETGHWPQLVPGAKPLGEIAIVESGALAQRVSSIQEGAVGVLSPPFDRARIANEFAAALVVMRDKREDGD
jgi:CheY-like chemotaxis protein